MALAIHGRKALDSLHTNTLEHGGDASVALGPKGAFAGIALDGAVLDVRQKLNAGYSAGGVEGGRELGDTAAASA
jgi:lipid-binding SYLF domain-containing protein